MHWGNMVSSAVEGCREGSTPAPSRSVNPDIDPGDTGGGPSATDGSVHCPSGEKPYVLVIICSVISELMF